MKYYNDGLKTLNVYRVCNIFWTSLSYLIIQTISVLTFHIRTAYISHHALATGFGERMFLPLIHLLAPDRGCFRLQCQFDAIVIDTTLTQYHLSVLVVSFANIIHIVMTNSKKVKWRIPPKPTLPKDDKLLRQSTRQRNTFLFAQYKLKF